MTSRTLTILFTDLVDSTGLMARLGGSRANQVMDRHFEGLRNALAVHRGREVKALGDGIMASFESVGDALACAVTMQRSVARHNDDGAEQRLEMRIGISAGEVGADENDCFGAPVVEASRLCDEAGSDEVLASEMVVLLAGGSGTHRLQELGPMTLKGIPDPITVHALAWDDDGQSAMRVALAEDSVLLRQGIAQMLEAAGMEVVLEADDADTLLARLAAARPHAVVLDVRMPPTHTTEGLDAAARIRAEHPQIGVLVLSAALEPGAAARLLSGGTDGIGYLLKERVTDVDELTAAIRTVAGGGSAIDPEVVSGLEPQAASR